MFVRFLLNIQENTENLLNLDFKISRSLCKASGVECKAIQWSCRPLAPHVYTVRIQTCVYVDII